MSKSSPDVGIVTFLSQCVFFSTQSRIVSVLFHILEDFIGQITRLSKFSQ